MPHWQQIDPESGQILMHDHQLGHVVLCDFLRFNVDIVFVCPFITLIRLWLHDLELG